MVNVRRSYADVSTGQIHFRSAAPEQESLAAPLLMLHMSPASGLIYEQLMGVFIL